VVFDLLHVGVGLAEDVHVVTFFDPPRVQMIVAYFSAVIYLLVNQQVHWMICSRPPTRTKRLAPLDIRRAKKSWPR